MHYKKHVFLLTISIFILGMKKEEAVPQKTMPSDPDKDLPNTSLSSLKLTHPSDLIDPKTGKPYKILSDAWDEFWNQASIRDQKLENRKIDIFLKETKKS